MDTIFQEKQEYDIWCHAEGAHKPCAPDHALNAIIPLFVGADTDDMPRLLRLYLEHPVHPLWLGDERHLQLLPNILALATSKDFSLPTVQSVQLIFKALLKHHTIPVIANHLTSRPASTSYQKGINWFFLSLGPKDRRSFLDGFDPCEEKAGSPTFPVISEYQAALKSSEDLSRHLNTKTAKTRDPRKI